MLMNNLLLLLFAFLPCTAMAQDVAMVLADALYFKCSWSEPFAPTSPN